MTKVIVGMSGGVDSAVAAYLLKQQGYDVVGVTLRMWEGEENRCCEIDDARRVAMKIGIPFYPLNCSEVFRDCVERPFVREYLRGMTPNPCIECNRFVKWDRMLQAAKALHADAIATGHYASVEKLSNGRYTVRKALHTEKDQAYMLYKLTQEQLAATVMPLGGLTKEDVRRIAAEAGLPVADKADSQEICFVPDGHYSDYVAEHAETPVPGEGNFVDEDGKVLGRHKGIVHYTVGQRKGLGIALGHPAYVKEIRVDTDEVVIADETALYSRKMICRDVNFMSIPEPESGATLRASVKVRYHHAGQNATLEMLPDGRVSVRFDEPVRAIAPGQSSVWYDENDCVVGGGIIESAE